MEELYDETDKVLERCRVLCQGCSVEEALAHYDFFVTHLKAHMRTNPKKKATLEKHLTYDARQIVEKVLESSYGQEYLDVKAVKKREKELLRRKKPRRISDKEMELIGCRHSGSCYENPRCLNWVHKKQCSINCLRANDCNNRFLNKSTRSQLVFKGKIALLYINFQIH